MIAKLRSITGNDSNLYQISLEDSAGAIAVFNFIVELGDVLCVTWRDDFADYMGQSLAPASALFEAVLAFHRAKLLSTSAPE